MTDQTPPDLTAWTEAIRAEAVSERLARTIIVCARIDRRTTAETLAAAIEEIGAGMPDALAFMDAIRADADFWADTATPVELEAFTAAGLRAIERTGFGLKARKRIFAALWETLDADDRRAFLARVDPAGKYRARR